MHLKCFIARKFRDTFTNSAQYFRCSYPDHIYTADIGNFFRPCTIHRTGPVSNLDWTVLLCLSVTVWLYDDWSMRISLVIFLVLSLVRICLGTPNLYCGSGDVARCTEGSLVHVYTNLSRGWNNVYSGIIV